MFLCNQRCTAAGKAVPVVARVADPQARPVLVVHRAPVGRATSSWPQTYTLAGRLQYRHVSPDPCPWESSLSSTAFGWATIHGFQVPGDRQNSHRYRPLTVPGDAAACPALTRFLTGPRPDRCAPQLAAVHPLASRPCVHVRTVCGLCYHWPATTVPSTRSE
jgi:hypothetical protein